MTEAPLLLSVRAASRELGIGRDRLYQLAREGRLRTIKLGRRLYVPRAELEAWVAREIEKQLAP